MQIHLISLFILGRRNVFIHFIYLQTNNTSINECLVSRGCKMFKKSKKYFTLRCFSFDFVVPGTRWNVDCVGSQSQMGYVQYIFYGGRTGGTLTYDECH